MQQTTTLFRAREIVLTSAQPLADAEVVPLVQAHGRHLAAAIVATEPWPTSDRSAMDGFALSPGASGTDAGAVFEVVGESLAGSPFHGTMSPGTAIRIMTGAVVPPGVDRVVPVELTSGFAGATVTLQQPVVPGANIRRLGSEVRAGTVVLAPGRRVRAAEVGVLAVLGHFEVCVRRRPRVAILATGDEVVAVDQNPGPHQVRESNSWALAAQVLECGGEPVRLGIAPDEAGPLRALLARGLAEADVLLTIGGISKGSHDLVHGLLAELGVAPAFHGVDLKPGKPTFFGMHGDAARRRYVFGLPGNPASTFTVFDLLVRPLLQLLAGESVATWANVVPAAGVPWQRNGRLQAVPAHLTTTADGNFAAHLVAPSPSGDPFSLTRGDVYALVPPNTAPATGAVLTIVGGSAGVSLP